jgi:hypothetical protein
MSDGAVEAMRARARAVRVRAAVRRWQYRQRHLAAGAWFRLRRTLAEAKAAYAISSSDAQSLLADGYVPDACGTTIEPAKTILFVDGAHLGRLESRRPIPVRLGPAFLTASAVALLPFDEVRVARSR